MCNQLSYIGEAAKAAALPIRVEYHDGFFFIRLKGTVVAAGGNESAKFAYIALRDDLIRNGV